MGRGRIGTSPPQTPSLLHLSRRKERCKQSPQRKRKRIKACATVKYPRAYEVFLFRCLCLLSFCRSRQEKSFDHFPKKQIRSPRRFRKERHFCCVIVLYQKTSGRFLIASAPTSPPGDGVCARANIKPACIQRSWPGDGVYDRTNKKQGYIQ